MSLLRVAHLPSASLAHLLLAGVAVAALSASAAYAQDQTQSPEPAPAAAEAAEAQPYDPDAETEVEELVVIAGVRTLPGSVIGDITPEVTLSPREIRAYGAADVTELLAALAPQLTSGQGGGGRPVVLINGARASSFAEIRDLPTEAIARVEILPEEVALKYGYSADQKVVNMVLRRRFRAWLAEGSVMSPTQDSGVGTAAAHGALLRIERGQRLTLDARVTDVDPILESDRGLAGDDTAFRTLQSQSRSFALNGVYARPLGAGVSGTLNGVFESTESEGKLGLSPFSNEALLRRSQTDNGSLAAAASGALAGWQWSYTGEVSRTVSTSDTDRALSSLAYTDRTKSTSTSAKSDIVLNKALWELPAGQVSTTLTGRVSTTELESEALRAGVTQSSDLSRSIGQVQANFDVPITRAGEGFGETLGRLSGNLNLNYQHLSDFGDLQTIGAGLNWTPVKPLRVLASFSRSDQAPTINQLGDPVTATPGVRVFDLSRGETAEIVRITGGIQDLDAGQRDTFKLGLTYKPFDETNLTFQANYVSTRTENAIVAFPSASTQVEAAFPDRFTRDANGILTQIDARPVNFARQSRDELRWGFTYSRPVGPQPGPGALAAMRRGRPAGESPAPPPEGEQRAQGPGEARAPAVGAGGTSRPAEPPQGERARPPSEGGPRGGDGPRAGGGFGGPGAGGPGGGGRGGGGFGGRGGGFGGGGPRGGVFQVGLYHTLAFRDDILIRPGLAKLDLLDGAAIGAGGGSPRHQIDLQANFTRNGLGAAVNARWESSTRVLGSGIGEDLDFSDQTTVNLRLFADLGQLPAARQQTWLRGARATLSIDNVFDSRQEVRTATGVTPISYQPDLLDPVGRSVKLTIRKLLF